MTVYRTDIECEVLKALTHAKGGHVVTFEIVKTETVSKDEKADKGQALCEQSNNLTRVTRSVVEALLVKKDWTWYNWPKCDRVGYQLAHKFQETWDAYQVRQVFNPPPEIAPPQPKGNPRRCMFCHEDMSGLAAHCLKCGGAMHLACAREGEERCLTPGCP